MVLQKGHYEEHGVVEFLETKDLLSLDDYRVLWEFRMLYMLGQRCRHCYGTKGWSKLWIKCDSVSYSSFSELQINSMAY